MGTMVAHAAPPRRLPSELRLKFLFAGMPADDVERRVASLVTYPACRFRFLVFGLCFFLATLRFFLLFFSTFLSNLAQFRSPSLPSFAADSRFFILSVCGAPVERASRPATKRRTAAWQRTRTGLAHEGAVPHTERVSDTRLETRGALPTGHRPTSSYRGTKPPLGVRQPALPSRSSHPRATRRLRFFRFAPIGDLGLRRGPYERRDISFADGWFFALR